MSDTHYLEDQGEKSVVIVMTSGPSTAHRCATPFYLGAYLRWYLWAHILLGWFFTSMFIAGVTGLVRRE